MTNVQQPEMRRSKHDPLVQDRIKATANTALPQKGKSGERARGKMPAEQRSTYEPRPEE